MGRLVVLFMGLGLLAGVGRQPPRLPRTCAVLVATGATASYRLTAATDGVRFDVDGDGVPEQVAWVENVFDVAFLAIDRNGNGAIDSGKELIGGQALREAGNGIVALDMLAPVPATKTGAEPRHEPGFLNEADAIWPKLVLWHDLNRNGKSEPEELRPFRDIFDVVCQIQK
jgi:hypothetical protein